MVDRLRELRADVPVIFISGYIDDSSRSGDFPASSYFLARPFAPAVLIQLVREALEEAARSGGRA